jgi:hypothetical protein
LLIRIRKDPFSRFGKFVSTGKRVHISKKCIFLRAFSSYTGPWKLPIKHQGPKEVEYSSIYIPAHHHIEKKKNESKMNFFYLAGEVASAWPDPWERAQECGPSAPRISG